MKGNPAVAPVGVVGAFTIALSTLWIVITLWPGLGHAGTARMSRGARRLGCWLGLVALLAQPAPGRSQAAIPGRSSNAPDASSPSSLGGPQAVCTNESEVEIPAGPARDRRDDPTDRNLRPAAYVGGGRGGQYPAHRGDDGALQYYGVLHGTEGTTDASLARLQRWQAAAPGRFIPALDFGDLTDATPERLGQLAEAGRVRVFGEISPQYDGELATTARLEPYFALAERLDIPVALHLGEGPPGGAYVVPGSRYLAAAGRPLDLEPLLRRHPRLRVYVMHYGSPLVDEMIALMYSHPQVYVDVARTTGASRARIFTVNWRGW